MVCSFANTFDTYVYAVAVDNLGPLPAQAVEAIVRLPKGVVFNEAWLVGLKNLFSELIPESSRFEDLIGVYDVNAKGLKIMSDILSQKVIAFFSRKKNI